jgi:uncharacterized protein (DUF2062 family)
MSWTISSIRTKAAVWLRQGISPRRLALTLALGFAIGCIPVIGIPTALCALLAVALRLNLPAIQAANYAVMPLQLALIFPFVRLGAWLFSSPGRHSAVAAQSIRIAWWELLTRLGGAAGHALVAWVIVAIPAVALMTAGFTLLLRRIPALSAVEAE